MSETAADKTSRRNSERYNCPSFFYIRIKSGGKLEEQAMVEDLSLRGLKVRTSCNFEEGAAADIELKTSYTAPVKIRGRMAWIAACEDEQASHIVGLSITKVRIVDWFRFIRMISQIKKEMW
jgi:hypothetical protein